MKEESSYVEVGAKVEVMIVTSNPYFVVYNIDSMK